MGVRWGHIEWVCGCTVGCMCVGVRVYGCGVGMSVGGWEYDWVCGCSGVVWVWGDGVVLCGYVGRCAGVCLGV